MHCTKCGVQLDGNLKFCTSCGNMITAPESPAQYPAPQQAQELPFTTPTPQQQQQQPPPQYQPQQTQYPPHESPAPYQPPAAPPPQHQAAAPVRANPNPLVSETQSSIKQIFKRPEDSILTSMHSNSPVWAILASLYVLVFGLKVLVLFDVFIMRIVVFVERTELDFWYAPFMTDLHEFERAIRELGLQSFSDQRFFNGLLIGAVYLLGLALCVKLLFSILKQNVSFLSTMKMVGSASLVCSIIMLAAVLLGLLVPTAWIGMLLVPLSITALHITVYTNIRNVGEFNGSPLWIYMLMITALNIVQYVFINSVLI